MARAPQVYDAVVVGAGPNGLTAAARLANAGRRVLVVEAAPTIGGGSRTKSLGGARYDVCAAVHPFGASSPAFEELQLDRHGLRWLHPPIALAHPFEDGHAAMIERRADAGPPAPPGRDDRRWRAAVGIFADDWEHLRHVVLAPVPRSLVDHPVRMARFGLVAGQPMSVLARVFKGRDAAALLTGLAAHGGARLSLPTTAGVGVALAAATEAVGMPVAAGGSQSIVDALASVIRLAGGEIETDRRISSRADLPRSRALLLDLTPTQAASVLGGPGPRWRYGVAACKLDLVLSGPMPWSAQRCREAGTVHLGGEWREVAGAERKTAAGRVVDRPFVIVAQPCVSDPARAPQGQHVVWAYRHVPNGCDEVAAVAGIERRFDQFAPGWRDLVLHRKVTTATDYEAYNANYVGGDIASGAMSPWQTIARPRLALDPYRLGRDDAWLCSQSTAPGPGVHGMCGWHAAGSVLHARRGAWSQRP